MVDMWNIKILKLDCRFVYKQQLSRYIREAYEHKERKWHPRVAEN